MTFILKMKSTNNKYILLVILLLLIGIVLYFFGRKIYFFELIKIEQTTFPLRGTLVLNYIPDLLWSLSLAISIRIYSKKKVLYTTAYVFAIILELTQLFSYTFTFDVLDITVITIAFFAVHILIPDFDK
jgi:hypothetical protein